MAKSLKILEKLIQNLSKIEVVAPNNKRTKLLSNKKEWFMDYLEWDPAKIYF